MRRALKTGPALSPADLGNPVSGNTGFRMCVYDTAGLVTELAVPGGEACGGDSDSTDTQPAQSSSSHQQGGDTSTDKAPASAGDERPDAPDDAISERPGGPDDDADIEKQQTGGVSPGY